MNGQPESTGIPVQVGEVWVRRESDEAAIYDPASGALHRLNPSALAIWELCDGRTTVREMAQAVSELTSLPLAAATQQVMAAIDHLRKSGLVEDA